MCDLSSGLDGLYDIITLAAANGCFNVLPKFAAWQISSGPNLS
jgi:hypothetical protein